MNLYLATPKAGHGREKDWSGLAILESFWYARKDKDFARYYPTARTFMLDSGAFTFMENIAKHRTITLQEWEAYTDEYIAFINKYDIKLFLEMDIDLVAGLEVAEHLRRRIELGTGKKPIPVWHINRGKDYFVDMCKNYPYVAFGGLMSDGKSRQTIEKAFPWFVATAHKYGAKIHALGYTTLAGVQKYGFDSVDSSSWTAAGRYLNLSSFDPRTGLVSVRNIGRQGMRMKSSTALLELNWKVWTQVTEWYRRNR